MASISSFKSQVSKLGGFSHTNFFRASINFPVAAVPQEKTKSENATLLCKAVNLPAANTSTLDYYYAGQPFKIPGDRQYEPWTCTFLVDRKFAVRNALLEWIDSNRPAEPSYMMGEAGNNKVFHTKTLRLELLDRVSKNTDPNAPSLYTIKLHSAYPTTIQGVDLDWGQADTIMEITCQFDYQYWTIEKRTDL